MDKYKDRTFSKRPIIRFRILQGRLLAPVKEKMEERHAENEKELEAIGEKMLSGFIEYFEGRVRKRNNG